MKRKTISILLTLCMVLTLLPMTALAVGATEQKSSSTIAVTIDLNTTYYDSQAEGWNAAVTAGAATVKLLANWTATSGSFGTGAGFGDGSNGGTGAILVPADKTITLDLNRFIINRALTAAQVNGNVITVNGVLTLMDGAGSYNKETYTYTAGGVYGGFNGGSGGTTTTPSVTVPVSSGSGSASVSATVSGGTASVSVTDSQLESIIDSAKETGLVSVDVSALSGVTAARLPEKLLAAAAKSDTGAGVEVTLQSGGVKLDEKAVEAVNNGKDVTISVENVKTADLTASQKETLGDKLETAVVVDVNITQNGGKVTDFSGGRLTISVPYTPRAGEDLSLLTVWYINDGGAIENLGGDYDKASGCFVFETTHLSEYVLVSDSAVVLPFTDASAGDWFYDDVAYVYKNKLLTGTSETTFSPYMETTRGMIVTVLWRLEGEPVVNYAMSFKDIDADSYFTEAVRWAASQGIVDGYDSGLFGADDSITREQMATILWRYAKYKGYDVSVGEDTNILSYEDALEVSEYAVPALQWAVGAGNMSGSGENLMPQGEATRCQAAAILHRFCEPKTSE